MFDIQLRTLHCTALHCTALHCVCCPVPVQSYHSLINISQDWLERREEEGGGRTRPQATSVHLLHFLWQGSSYTTWRESENVDQLTSTSSPEPLPTHLSPTSCPDLKKWRTKLIWSAGSLMWCDDLDLVSLLNSQSDTTLQSTQMSDGVVGDIEFPECLRWHLPTTPSPSFPLLLPPVGPAFFLRCEICRYQQENRTHMDQGELYHEQQIVLG